MLEYFDLLGLFQSVVNKMVANDCSHKLKSCFDY